MYEQKQLREAITDYLHECHNAPRRGEFAQYLGVSRQTVDNAINGTFNGNIYGIKPHVKRVFSNDCFELVRGVFRTNAK